jgi:UDP-N-acetylmuramate dehydrogenase
MKEFLSVFRPDQVLPGEPLRKHTTFQIGGPAALMVLPESRDQVQAALGLCAGRPHMVLGRGSNVLFADEGYPGVVIKLDRPFGEPRVEGTTLRAEAGLSLAALAARALEAGLAGLEFASGIPGTLGGAIFMNAGAYGSEIKDVVTEVDVLRDGALVRLRAEEMEFGYRSSQAQRRGWVVLGARLALAPGDREEIRRATETYNRRRKETQPLELPSAGSVFKRPEGYFAGKLIMDAGLAGARAGGAQVSPKHCGFIVNTGNATAADVRNLIAQVQTVVYEKFGVGLEPEIRIL